MLFAAPTTRAAQNRPALRRGGRVVECTALEMRHRCKPIGSSNLPLSASSHYFMVYFHTLSGPKDHLTYKITVKLDGS